MMGSNERVLILGAYGMLGHKLVLGLGQRFETWATCRQIRTDALAESLVPRERLLEGVWADDLDTVIRAVARVRPSFVLNAIGIVKQRDAAKVPIPSLKVNALFPHRLATVTQAAGSRLVHFSTDCVFSGRKGGYREDDVSDAEDLYGRTKFLGEVAGDGCLTLRSSIIGYELGSRLSLIEWFVAHAGKQVPGFTRAIYSGLTTTEMTRVVCEIIANAPDLSGLWQVSSMPISKFDLLQSFNKKAQLGITVIPDESFKSDRSLDGSRFAAKTDYVAPSWEAMIDGLVAELPRYHFKR